MYNGYGHYLPEWVKSIKKAQPTDILVVLGENHGADLEHLDREGVKYIETDSTKGIRHNIALNNIKTEYVMMFDVDDTLLPNAVDEIMNKETDVVALKYLEKYKGSETIKQSATMTKGNFDSWKQISTPGYYAFRKYLNGDIMYFDNVGVPKFPHLFKLASRGATMTHTDEVCAVYNRVREHSQKTIQSRTKAIEERLKHYE